MTAYYDTLIVTFSDPIRILDMMCTDTCTKGVDRELRKYKNDPDKRTYGSHYFRIQHGACGGMAQKIYPHCRNERILKVWRYTIPPTPETDNP